jgi:hypothetical protein
VDLRKIFVRSREDETERGGKLCKKGFFFVKCYSGDQIKLNAMGGYVTPIGEKKKCIHSFLGEA